jgi:hypothetical protein
MAEVNRSTAELRVLITEDAQGNFDVQWAANIKDHPNVVVPLRTSHVIGQLQLAAAMIRDQGFKQTTADDPADKADISPVTISNSPKGKANGKRKVRA